MEKAILLRSRLDHLLGRQRVWLHVILFILTFFTTSVAGVQWRGVRDPFDLTNLGFGFEYASLILIFLTAHEFGHFIAARIHKVDATLPFYIPFPGFLLGSINFGTFGAVIRTRSRVRSNKAMFDIGVAGPIAGFIVCVGILLVGFLTLPGIEYLQSIHPGYPKLPASPGGELKFGRTLLFTALQNLAPSDAYVPPMSEVYHYPMLCVGWFGLFVTALNLLPVGQLDGGHLTFTLWGTRPHNIAGKITAAALFLISLPEVVAELLSNSSPGWLHTLIVPGGSTWLLWAIITTFVIRFRHPPTDDDKLDPARKLIGYFTLVVFVLCFTPSPLIIE